jgi:hypothetical protein
MDVANALVSFVLQMELLRLPCHCLGFVQKKVSFSDHDWVVSSITARGTLFFLLLFYLDAWSSSSNDFSNVCSA